MDWNDFIIGIAIPATVSLIISLSVYFLKGSLDDRQEKNNIIKSLKFLVQLNNRLLERLGSGVNLEMKLIESLFTSGLIHHFRKNESYSIMDYYKAVTEFNEPSVSITKQEVKIVGERLINAFEKKNRINRILRRH